MCPRRRTNEIALVTAAGAVVAACRTGRRVSTASAAVVGVGAAVEEAHCVIRAPCCSLYVVSLGGRRLGEGWLALRCALQGNADWGAVVAGVAHDLCAFVVVLREGRGGDNGMRQTECRSSHKCILRLPAAGSGWALTAKAGGWAAIPLAVSVGIRFRDLWMRIGRRILPRRLRVLSVENDEDIAMRLSECSA